MLCEQARRDRYLVIVLLAVPPGQQGIHRTCCLRRLNSCRHSQLEQVEFGAQLFPLQTGEASIERQVDVISLTADLATFELVLGKLPVAQYADDLEPEMIDLDVFTDRIAVGKQIARSLTADDRDLCE